MNYDYEEELTERITAAENNLASAKLTDHARRIVTKELVGAKNEAWDIVYRLDAIERAELCLKLDQNEAFNRRLRAIAEEGHRG